jgi:DnaJ-class molecular chaperone
MSPKCYSCGGQGNRPCQICKGTGEISPKVAGEAKKTKKKITCPHCRGTGRISCHVCGGTGRL